MKEKIKNKIETIRKMTIILLKNDDFMCNFLDLINF